MRASDPARLETHRAFATLHACKPRGGGSARLLGRSRRYVSSRRHARMGSDRSKRVVDADCRSWDIPNLWICDGSVLQWSAEPIHRLPSKRSRAGPPIVFTPWRSEANSRVIVALSLDGRCWRCFRFQSDAYFSETFRVHIFRVFRVWINCFDVPITEPSSTARSQIAVRSHS
jgi:hypothetical protein